MGKAYYKGGFEAKMNRREAALILETSYGTPIVEPFLKAIANISRSQGTRTIQRDDSQEAPPAHDPQSPRSRRKPIPCDQD